MGKVGGNFMV